MPGNDDGELLSWRNPSYENSGDHPVVCVSRGDAESYAAWKSLQLSSRTELPAPLRLPTEAEFEHALRTAGRTSETWGPEAIDRRVCGLANIGDAHFKKQFSGWPNTALCDDGFTFTAPVASYPADSLGFHDISGNVWEWAADCYRASYENAPVDGSARQASNPDSKCETGVLRGASFDDGPQYQRFANRVRVPISVGAWVFGIRLAHSLSD